MLDKDSPIPLYYQLVEDIRDRIRAGEYRPGQQLPSERELSEQYGISRMTVRQALQYLIREDVLIAQQGVGTFVAEPKLAYDPLHALGFTEAMMQRGAAASSRVIEQTVAPAPPRIAAQLSLAEADSVIKIVRLRLSNGAPVLLETVHLPHAVFPGLEKVDLTRRSLYQLMRDEYGVWLHGAQHTLEAVLANDYESELFGIPAGLPMILLQGVTFDEEDRPVEVFKAVYRGDRFKIQLDSRPKARREAFNASLMSVVMR